jgi:hypothetical protein
LQAGCQRFESANLHRQSKGEGNQREDATAPAKGRMLANVSKHLDNCIEERESQVVNSPTIDSIDSWENKDNPSSLKKVAVKLQRANGGYLGM